MQILPRLRNRSKDFLFVPFLDMYWRQRLLGKVVCFLYHRVDEPHNNLFLSRGGSPVIRPKELKEELEFLKSQRPVFLTFSDLRKGKFPGNSEFGVIISFDDCFLDNYTTGLDVLERLGLPCVFFQTTGMISAKTLLWEHLLYWLNRDEDSFRAFQDFLTRYYPECIRGNSERHKVIEFLRESTPMKILKALLEDAVRYLTSTTELMKIAQRIYPQVEHIQKAHSLGHEIGSHGHNHYKRENIDAETFQDELRLSFNTLKETSGEEPRVFSYPFSSYKEQDDQICSKYFLQAATVDKDYITTRSDPMRLPRFTWPGSAPYPFRRRRWLLTGRI